MNIIKDDWSLILNFHKIRPTKNYLYRTRLNHTNPLSSVEGIKGEKMKKPPIHLALILVISFTLPFTATAATIGSFSAKRGTPQIGEKGKALANPFVASVRDTDGNPVVGETVAFDIISSPTQGSTDFDGATLSAATATTDANGEASSTLTLGTALGEYNVIASLDTWGARFTAKAHDPYVLELVSGNNQTDTACETLAPFVVKLKNSGTGAGVFGETVKFSIISEPASDTGARLTIFVRTDGGGEASSTLTLGRVAGTYTVRAETSILQQTFTATAAGVPTLEYVRGNNQIGIKSKPLPIKLVVRLKDHAGMPMGGKTVGFVITSSPSGDTDHDKASLTVVENSTTRANGTARTELTLGDTPGTYEVIAYFCRKTFTFSATVPDPSAANTLEIVSGNAQTGTVGQALANPFVVVAKDSNGSAMSGRPVTFTIATTPTGSTGTSLSAETVNTGSNGQASTTLTLGSTTGTYTVTASTLKTDGTTLTQTFSATATAAPKIATTLQKSSGDGQSAQVSTQLSNPLVVKVLDQDGAALSGVLVSFSVSPTSGSLSTSSATTGSDGQASTTLTLGSTTGTYTVTASVDGITDTVSFTATATAPPKVATTLQKRSGDSQSAQVSTQLSNPLVVRVLDQDGSALSGVSVSFSVSPTSGALGASTATTNAQGEASTTLTLGSTTGTYTVTASASGITSTVSFTATATAPPPPPKVATTLQKRSGDSQSGQVSTQLSNPLVVRVLDQDGSALSGVSVSFSVSPTSGSLSASTATTGSDGQASTTLTLGSTTGTYTVTASASGIASTVSFTATATAPPPPPPPDKVATTLQKRSGDSQSAQVSTQLSNPLVVRVLDQDSAALSGVSVSFSVSPTSGSLSASSATTNAQGEASTRLTLGSTAGTYTVTASASGITSTVSFTATATAPPPPPPPDKVATTLQKRSGDSQSAQVSTQLGSPLVVRVLDQDGAALGGVSVSFSVSPSSGTLNPSTATTGTDGQASTTLTLGGIVGSHAVTASVTKPDGTTLEVTFSATAQAAPPPPPPPVRVATTLQKQSGDGQSAQVSTQLSSVFVVRVLDQDGAALSGVSVSFTVSPSGILSASTATTDTDGQASTTLTLGSATGTYTVTASVSGITGTVSFTATATAPPVIVDPVTPDPVTPDPVTPGPEVSDPGTPDAEASATSTPGPEVSDPGTPESSDPVTPDPEASTTSTPDPEVSDPGTPEFSDPGTPESSDPVTPDAGASAISIPGAAWGDVIFSEVMYASNGWSDVQWIELYNTSATETFQLEGWRLRLLSVEGETSHDRYITITLKPIELEPKGVTLLVTRKADKAQHSESIEEQMIYDLSEHHNDVLSLDEHPRRVIGVTGFTLQLFSEDWIPIDRLGNVPLNYNNPTDRPPLRYRFGDITASGAVGRTRDKRRVSLIRRINNAGRALNGDKIRAWKRTATLNFTEENPRTYYGSATDIGTPGYIYEPLPLPVTLSAFSARTSDNAVILNWTTESEIDNAGFNILRSETEDGEFEVVNPQLIQGAGTTAERNEYTWTDTTAKPDMLYYYRIEDISYSGVRKQLATVQLRGYLTAKGKFTTTWADFKTPK